MEDSSKLRCILSLLWLQFPRDEVRDFSSSGNPRRLLVPTSSDGRFQQHITWRDSATFLTPYNPDRYIDHPTSLAHVTARMAPTADALPVLQTSDHAQVEEFTSTSHHPDASHASQTANLATPRRARQHLHADDDTAGEASEIDSIFEDVLDDVKPVKYARALCTLPCAAASRYCY